MSDHYREGFNVMYELCAVKRGHWQATSFHWCNQCPPLEEYKELEKLQKAAWRRASTLSGRDSR